MKHIFGYRDTGYKSCGLDHYSQFILLVKSLICQGLPPPTTDEAEPLLYDNRGPSALPHPLPFGVLAIRHNCRILDVEQAALCNI